MGNLFESVKKEAQHLMENSKGSHNFDHVERVLNLCIKIGEKESADMEILKLAAILHDIGRRHEDECKGRLCHAEKGAEIAAEILKRYGVGNEKIGRITHCIKTHRYRGKNIPETKEAKILFDADKLDCIGAVGIGRSFLFAGEVGARLHDPNIDVEKTQSYTIEDTAYREYLVKLRHVYKKMLTGEGRRIAKQRHDFMVDFFNRLNEEVDGEK